MQTNYSKYRGKCKKLCEEAIRKDPTLKLVRGYYSDPIWNKKEQHWWTERENGELYDPSAKQFPSAGHGTYLEFDGWVECEQCGKKIEEDKIVMAGSYPCCSQLCALRLVGLK